MADEKKKEAAPAAAAPPAEGEEGEKKGGNLILVIGIIVGIVVLQTVLVYLIVPKPVDEAAIAEKREQDSLRLIAEAATRMGAVTSDPIEAVVNLAGTDGERFLKASIILEYDDKNKALEGELTRRAPRFRDIFIRHLSTLSLMEVTEPQAKDKICQDLLRQINSTLPPDIGEVTNVLFTTFIIQ